MFHMKSLTKSIYIPIEIDMIRYEQILAKKQVGMGWSNRTEKVTLG
jgi:hypothetical protein